MTLKSKNRRTEILEKSARLFRKRGYAATSMRDIAQEVGMESASLYNHIKSKQEVLQTLLLPLAHRYVSGIEEINAAPLPAIQKLERIIIDQILITIDNIDAVSLVPDQWIHLDDKQKVRTEYLQFRDQYEALFLQIFRQAIEEKDLKAVHVEIACFSILSTLRRLYSWYARHRNINRVVLETELIQNLLGGLRNS